MTILLVQYKTKAKRNPNEVVDRSSERRNVDSVTIFMTGMGPTLSCLCGS